MQGQKLNFYVNVCSQQVCSHWLVFPDLKQWEVGRGRIKVAGSYLQNKGEMSVPRIREK